MQNSCEKKQKSCEKMRNSCEKYKNHVKNTKISVKNLKNISQTKKKFKTAQNFDFCVVFLIECYHETY